MNSLFRLFESLLNKHGRYKVFGKSFKFNNLVNGTATLSLETAHKYFTKLSGVASIQTGISSLSVNSGDIVCDLTLLQDASTTLEQFYATDLGKEIQKGFYPPYSPTNAIYEADLSEMTFKYDTPAMASLLEKQNVPADIQYHSTANIYVGCLNNNSFGSSRVNATNKKNFNTINGHKYFVVLKMDRDISSFTTANSFTIRPYYQTENPTYINPTTSYIGINSVCGVFEGLNTYNETGISLRFYNITTELGETAFNAKYVLVIDLTELGLDNLTAQQFYDRYHDKFEQLANGETVFKPQTVSILQNGQPLKIGGIGTAKDYYLNASGKVNRAIGNVDLGTKTYSYDSYNIAFYTSQSNLKLCVYGQTQPAPNMLCSLYTARNTFFLRTSEDKIITTNNSVGQERIFIKDTQYGTDANAIKTALNGVILHYELATPTTEQANSVMLRKGFTKCYDKNNLELEIEVIDPLNFSNKIVQGKNTPTITAEKVITKGFTSGGEHFTQLYIYEDGEIWYVNSQGSAQAYASGVWELEYKQLQFDNKVSLTESERNALLNIYDLL